MLLSVRVPRTEFALSGILIRVPVAVVASMVVALAGAAASDCLSENASAPGSIALMSRSAPAGRWSVPLDVAPAKIDSSVSHLTYDCGSQSPIRIVGSDSTIELNGSCGEVDISGVYNTVNLQTVAIIKATGTGNHITWVKGPGGTVPQISNPGVSNDIRGPGGIVIQSSKG
jgi:Protein of unknown function (DUF3060)